MSNSEQQARVALWESVVFRVLAICFLLIILPLILHAVLLYRGNYSEKIHDIITNLKTLAFADHFADRQWSHYTGDIVESLSSGDHSSAHLAAIVKKEDYVFLLHMVKKGSNEYLCTEASSEEYLGKTNLFVNELNKVSVNKNAFFGVFDPFSGEPIDLVIFSHNGIDFYLLGELIKSWVIEEAEYLNIKKPFYLTVLRNDNVVLYSTDPSFSIQETQFLDLDAPDAADKFFETKLPVVGVKIPSIASDYALCISFFKNSVQKDILSSVLIKVVSFFLFYVLLGGSLAFFLSYRMQKPLQNLYQTMRGVKEGKLEMRYQPLGLGFEINRVGEYFNETVAHLVEYLKNEQEERGKRQVLENELNIAQKIQQSLFPRNIQLSNLDIAARFLPAKIVSGDFYDIYLVNDKLLFLVADASGKGIPASLFSLSVRSYVRSNFCNTQDLKEIIALTNHLFLEDTKDSSDFVTVLLGVYDLKTHVLSYSSRGHNPGFIKRRDGRVEPLSTPGIAFGVTNLDKVDIKETSLEPGDFVFLYTDGLVEAQNPENKFYTKRRLDQFIEAHPISSTTEFLDALLSDLERFRQGADLFDDVTLLAVKRLN